MSSLVETKKSCILECFNPDEFTNHNILLDCNEITIPKLNNMILRLGYDFAHCIDIDMENKDEFIEKFNIHLVGKKITSMDMIVNIYNMVNELIKKPENDNFNFDPNLDPLFIFSKREIKTKYKINRELVLQNFNSRKFKQPKSAPHNFKLNYKQVFEMIYSEVEKINSNFNFEHYIKFKDDNPYELCFRFRYNKGELSEKLKILNNNFNFDYIEIIVKLDNEFYPFVAPTIEYSKPNMSPNVIYNIQKISILEDKKWNSNISLEWLIVEIGNQFEKYFNKYIDITKEELVFEKIENNIFKLFNIMGINDYEKFDIHFELPNFTENKKNLYWSSGTGYGHTGNIEWDINSYIKKKMETDKIIIKYLLTINMLYNDCNCKDNVKKIMNNFISTQLRGTNILDFNKNSSIYLVYINIIQNMELAIDIKIILDLYNEINEILSNDTLVNGLESHKLELYKLFISQFKEKIEKLTVNSEIVISDDLKQQYVDMTFKNRFTTYIFDNYHLFHKFEDRKIVNKKTLLRLISEISSLKKNLPINWDTSSILSVDKKYANMIKFIITGPKDTPYHNGIYEFHAYFPPSYPNDPPQVLLNTTDGGRVRFNPNLYDSGKVCLSLLGTWSGQQGEKWNPEISTFLQVIISIQSLIFVSEPYFNEPGYERSMHTSYGKERSFHYKDNIWQENLKVAIINQIKNPPKGFEEFTINHFKLKKEEIIETAEGWAKQSRSKVKIDSFIEEFKELIN